MVKAKKPSYLVSLFPFLISQKITTHKIGQKIDIKKDRKNAFIFLFSLSNEACKHKNKFTQ
jgi:hypothetical protein